MTSFENQLSETRANLAHVEAQRDELRAALQTILDGFEQGIFVRDISGDGSNDWAVKLLPFMAALGKAQAALARSKGAAA